MYVTYWLDPTSLQCPSCCDTIHTWKSNYFWHTLLRVQEWSNNLTIYFKEPLALPTYMIVQQFDCTLLRVWEWSNNLTIHYKEPLALPTYLKVKQFDYLLFKMLATRYDWGQQFAPDPACLFEPRSASLSTLLVPSALARVHNFSSSCP